MTTTKNEKKEKNEKKDLIHVDQNPKIQNEYQEFLNLFNAIRKKFMPKSRGFTKLGNKAKLQLKSLISDGYIHQDFEEAISNMFMDSHHRKSNWKWATPELVTRSEKFTRFLHSQPEFSENIVMGKGASLAIS